MKCKHYKGDGYSYEVNGTELNLCDECHKELIKQIEHQIELEETLK